MIAQKINSLVGKYVCRHCPQHHELDDDYCKGSDPESMTLNAIVQEFLALIASEQQPMVEALKEARKQILHLEEKSDKTLTSTDMVLAKIDAALKGEGK